MKTTTNTCKNQKFRRKIQKESVEGIQTLRRCLKFLYIIHWTSSISQWEPSIL